VVSRVFSGQVKEFHCIRHGHVGYPLALNCEQARVLRPSISLVVLQVFRFLWSDRLMTSFRSLWCCYCFTCYIIGCCYTMMCCSGR
jgi:hypothetical protein